MRAIRCCIKTPREPFVNLYPLVAIAGLIVSGAVVIFGGFEIGLWLAHHITLMVN